MIRTTDSDWTAKHAAPGPEADTAAITFPASAATEATFCGRRMLRIDLQAIAGALPADCLNRWVAIPDIHIMANPVPYASR